MTGISEAVASLGELCKASGRFDKGEIRGVVYVTDGLEKAFDNLDRVMKGTKDKKGKKDYTEIHDLDHIISIPDDTITWRYKKPRMNRR